MSRHVARRFGACRCRGGAKVSRKRREPLISSVRFDARRGAFECSGNMDEAGPSRDGAQQALWSVGATLGSRFVRWRHGGSAFGPSATQRARDPSVRRFRVRILSVYNFSGSGLVHSRISGSDTVHLEPFLAFRWTKDEPRIGGWPKPEPEIGGWPKSEPNMPCRAGWSTLMDKRRTQHARSGGLEHVDGRAPNPGYDDWARCEHELRRWRRNERGDGAALQSAACGGNGPSQRRCPYGVGPLRRRTCAEIPSTGASARTRPQPFAGVGTSTRCWNPRGSGTGTRGPAARGRTARPGA